MAKEPEKNLAQKRSRRMAMWASVLILIGLLLTLGNTGLVPNAWGMLWPLVLVVIGAFLLWPQE